MNGLNSREYALLYALMSGENAEPLNVLSMRVEANPADVAVALDTLVEKRILEADVSYAKSAIGEIDYLFAGNPYAQQVYQQVLDENPHLT